MENPSGSTSKNYHSALPTKRLQNERSCVLTGFLDLNSIIQFGHLTVVLHRVYELIIHDFVYLRGSGED